MAGSPPHMRGKVDGKAVKLTGDGITPRTCGEKLFSMVIRIWPLGSPPHMRGKVGECLGSHLRLGITPAHAGKSQEREKASSVKRDHPRTCGEKNNAITGRVLDVGSPPHMRGKDKLTHFVACSVGITPAHAGKSWPGSSLSPASGDHPRTCGEKREGERGSIRGQGSPPHMRGKEASLTSGS